MEIEDGGTEGAVCLRAVERPRNRARVDGSYWSKDMME